MDMSLMTELSIFIKFLFNIVQEG